MKGPMDIPLLSIQTCLRCGSKNLMSGTTRGGENVAFFLPDHVRFLSTMIGHHVMIEPASRVCIDCGLLISSVDPVKAKKLDEDYKK